MEELLLSELVTGLGYDLFIVLPGDWQDRLRLD